MKIALVAPVEETVPPRKYGGIELVVAHLANGLVRQGHDVTLFASGDSHTDATLVPLVPQAVRTLTAGEGQDRIREAWKYVALAKLMRELDHGAFDIIHQHMGWRFSAFEQDMPAPVVQTLHGILTPSYIQFLFRNFRTNKYISISDAQRTPLPDLDYVGTVYNGIEVSSFPFVEQPADYLAFLGRMSPEKGPKEAILAARAANMRLKMAAKVDAVDRDYFEQEIQPLIDGTQVEFLGEVDAEQRNELLGHAKALLAPIQWDEPFGLYFVEAMATGTPVLSFGRGSVPEIVEDGVTGFFVEPAAGVEGMTELIRKLMDLSDGAYAAMRQASRRRVESAFSVERMVEGYLDAYARILAGERQP